MRRLRLVSALVTLFLAPFSAAETFFWGSCAISETQFFRREIDPKICVQPTLALTASSPGPGLLRRQYFTRAAMRSGFFLNSWLGAHIAADTNTATTIHRAASRECL